MTCEQLLQSLIAEMQKTNTALADILKILRGY